LISIEEEGLDSCSKRPEWKCKLTQPKFEEADLGTSLSEYVKMFTFQLFTKLPSRI